ncbi:MAG: hypothetical protein ACUVV1_00520 [Fimbriimonadales bacterium]
MNAWLGISDAPCLGWHYRWLRLFRADGSPVPTAAEQAQEAQQRAEQAGRRLAALEAALKRLRGEQ